MKIAGGEIFGEALDGLGRWYLAVPPVLVVGFLAALFLAAGGGQARLQRASAALQAAAARERAVDELDDTLLQTQGSMRGYLLTDAPRFLEQYRRASAQVEPRLNALRDVYRGVDPPPALSTLRELVAQRTQEYGTILALHDQAGVDRASDLIKSEQALLTSQALFTALARLHDRQRLDHAEAAARWESSLQWSRWLSVAGTVLNLLLIGITSRLVFADLRRRSRETAALKDQKAQLELDVESRTRELAELSTHLQIVAEREKANLARELHDELGGLLVGARMDLSWAERRIGDVPVEVRERLGRVQESLAAGVDLKRRIIEELRPTLLDNVGLYAALRWQLEESASRAGLRCESHFPEFEPRFSAAAAIALFRIAQESCTNVIKHARATRVSLLLDVTPEVVTLQIADDGVGIAPRRSNAAGTHGLAAMRQRARALGGTLDVTAGAQGTVVLARVPARRVIEG